jgi:hypothetical protein
VFAYSGRQALLMMMIDTAMAEMPLPDRPRACWKIA